MHKYNYSHLYLQTQLVTPLGLRTMTSHHPWHQHPHWDTVTGTEVTGSEVVTRLPRLLPPDTCRTRDEVTWLSSFTRGARSISVSGNPSLLTLVVCSD